MLAADDDDRDHAARRRAAIRRYHPDAGGTAEELTAALAAFRPPNPSVTVARTVRGRVGLVLRRFVLRRRRGLPPRNLK